jgi:NAD(P) transhydrogenase subunit alpha
MICYVPAENPTAEPRAALVPVTAKALVQLGLEVRFAPGLGLPSGYADAEFLAAGAVAGAGHATELAQADLVLRVRKPAPGEVGGMKRGAVTIGFVDPFSDLPLLQAFVAAGVSAVSLEMIPRTTLAQKMDALSSQASLAGYAAVLQAAGRLRKILPMMMTPAGTIMPSRVFVIGAGVASVASGAAPVVIKSLVFPTTAALGRVEPAKAG